MIAYTKLTVVMCCQIVARKSVAPSSGNFRQRQAPRYVCGQDQEFWRKKSFSKIIITPFPWPRPDLRECEFSRATCFFACRGVPNWKSDSDFSVFKKSTILLSGLRPNPIEHRAPRGRPHCLCGHKIVNIDKAENRTLLLEWNKKYYNVCYSWNLVFNFKLSSLKTGKAHLKWFIYPSIANSLFVVELFHTYMSRTLYSRGGSDRAQILNML